MRSSVEPLEGNFVRLSVELDDDELEGALAAAFRRIGREVRIPGFRPGKAPRRILEARLGAEAARQEALREALPEYYARAVTETDLDAIAAPDLELTSGREEGPVAFDAVVEVRPRVAVPGYANLRVTVPSPVVEDQEVDEQIERLRSQFGELAEVARPARDGDHVSIDLSGSHNGEPVEGLTADDYLYQVGSEAIVAELDDQLRGSRLGDILAFHAPHPDAEVDGLVSFRVLVKKVQAQALPEVDDDWASEASEFETLSELRADLAGRLSAMKRLNTQLRLRDEVMAALVDLVAEDSPVPLVDAEVERRTADLARRLERRGTTVEQYLESLGQGAEALAEQLRSQASAAVKADLALRAVMEAEGVRATDEELEAEIHRLAEQVEEKPAALRRRLERAGQVEAIRFDVSKGKALEWLVGQVEIVDEDGRPVDRSALEDPTGDTSSVAGGDTDLDRGDTDEGEEQAG